MKTTIQFSVKIIIHLLILTLLSCTAEVDIAIREAKENNSIDALKEVLKDFPTEGKVVEKVEMAIKEVEYKIDHMEYGSFTDPRDNYTYKTILMRDGRIWMAENLQFFNTSIEGHTWCPHHKEKYCKEFGRLYNWEVAKIACPEGWELPSDDDWWNLFQKYGGADQSWLNSNANGRRDKTDGKAAYWALVEDTKWNAQLSGWRREKIKLFGDDEYTFDDVGKDGRYWTSTQIPEDEIILYLFRGSPGIEQIIQNSVSPRNYWGMSCRCIKKKVIIENR